MTPDETKVQATKIRLMKTAMFIGGIALVLAVLWGLKVLEYLKEISTIYRLI